MQHTKTKTAISEQDFILPYGRHKIIESQSKSFEGCCSLSV